MTLTNYQQFCYGRLGQYAEERVSEKLNESLSSAHINLRGAAYLSWVWMTSLFVLVGSLIAFSTLLVILLFVAKMQLDITTIVFLPLLSVILGGVTYVVCLMRPRSTAKARGKKIDLHLPYALNFISAMSSAGITPTEIFKSLSKQEIYGEVKEEASWIYRDVAVLGTDIITAIRDDIKRTPSQKFKEFLQGTVVTVTSGGSLKSYFFAKADQYMRENRQAQKQRIESLGIMAETYVTAAVAGVLMLLIIIPLMMIISVVSGTLSGDAFNSQLSLMYLIVFLMIPIIHGGFTFIIRSMSLGG